jgi:hypothetical protein
MVWLNIGEKEGKRQLKRDREEGPRVSAPVFCVYEGNKFNSAITHARFEDIISASKWSQ